MGTPVSCWKCNTILGMDINLHDIFMECGFGEFSTIHYGMGQYMGQHLEISKSELKKFEEFMRRKKIIEELEKAKIELKEFEKEDGEGYSIISKIVGEKKTKQFWENFYILRVCSFYNRLYKHCIAHLNNGTKEIIVETMRP